jgi:pilus assembly protein CpaD
MTKETRTKSRFAILALASLLAACNGKTDEIHTSLDATHIPVVSQAHYIFDAAAPGGVMTADEMNRLNDWLGTLEVDYGDRIYVDGPDGPARGQVAAVAGNYGLLLSSGAPVTAGAPNPNSVRVVLSRAEASVPGCPDWAGMSEPNFDNKPVPNYGCGVSGALAMQVANAQDLVHGHAGPAAEDGGTAARAINMYRTWPLTGLIDGQTRRPMKKTETFTKEK